MNKPHIQIIMSTTREGRKGDVVANWVEKTLEADVRATFELLDLRDYPMPFYEESSTPKGLEGKYKSEAAMQWVKKISKADGYIIVNAEYNHGYPAVLKNALDYAYTEWNKKPIAFVSYGGPGAGIRSTEQLRLVSVELQMAPIQFSVLLPLFSRLFDEKGDIKDEGYNERLKAMADQLLWWTNALKTAREVQVS